MKKSLLLPFVLYSSLFCSQDMEELKELILQQRHTIEELKQRVDRLENGQSGTAHEDHHEHKTATESAHSKPGPLEIALVANMSVLARNIGNESYADYSIPGFIDSAGEIPFNPNRGFNLNYAEIEFESRILPDLELYSSLHVEKEALHIGELFVKSGVLGHGTSIKAGRFRSGFSRQNELHQHGWSFTTPPLVYESFFGYGALAEDGVQLQYKIGTEAFTLAGIEALQGENERSFGNRDRNNLYVAYLRDSFHISDSAYLLLGATWMHGRSAEGGTDIYAAEARVDWKLSAEASLEWENEVLFRDRGSEERGGMCTQLLYNVGEWGTGVRYDRLFENGADLPEDLDRYSAMVVYKPFPFTKLRLQYTYDRSKFFNSERRDVSEILLDLTIEAGGHEGHSGHNH